MSKPAFKWLHLPHHIPGPVVFAVFALLIIANLAVVLVYVNRTAQEQHLAEAEDIIEHISNTVYLLEISPLQEWPRIADVSQTPELAVYITYTPDYPLQIRDHSMEEFNDVVHNIPNDLALSIKLSNDTWLNAKYTEERITDILRAFIVGLGIMVTIALLFSAWSMMRFTMPLKNFKTAAEQLGMQLRSEPVIEYGPSIVRETAYAMNQMQDKIRKLLQDRNLMLAAISHDLRTPITRLKLRAQFEEDEDQKQEILRDLNEMEAMIKQILAYTRDASATEKEKDFDLAAMIMFLCDMKSEQGYKVNVDAKVNRMPISGRALALKRAFNNLLNNAVKYANEVMVTIDMENGHYAIIIDDDGPGIPEKKLDKVFTAFYRVDPSRSSKTGGTGLGLAIAQDIIHEHHGVISVKNREQGGLQVKILLEQKHSD